MVADEHNCHWQHETVAGEKHVHGGNASGGHRGDATDDGGGHRGGTIH